MIRWTCIDCGTSGESSRRVMDCPACENGILVTTGSAPPSLRMDAVLAAYLQGDIDAGEMERQIDYTLRAEAARR